METRTLIATLEDIDAHLGDADWSPETTAQALLSDLCAALHPCDPAYMRLAGWLEQSRPEVDEAALRAALESGPTSLPAETPLVEWLATWLGDEVPAAAQVEDWLVFAVERLPQEAAALVAFVAARSLRRRATTDENASSALELAAANSEEATPLLRDLLQRQPDAASTAMAEAELAAPEEPAVPEAPPSQGASLEELEAQWASLAAHGRWQAVLAGIEAALKDPALAAPPALQAQLLDKMVAIYRDELSLPAQVIQTLQRRVALEPEHVEGLQALKEAFVGAKRWSDVIATNTRLAGCVDASARTELLLENASLWLERFANYNKAAALLEALHGDGQADSRVLDTLAELYRKRRAYGPLARALRSRLALGQLAQDVEIALRTELAEVLSRRLRDAEAAVVELRAVLELDASQHDAQAELERLCERERDYEILAWSYELRIDGGDDPEARVRWMQKLAALLEDKLNAPERAYEIWERLLDDDPTNARALRVLRRAYVQHKRWDALEALYEKLGDFDGLAEALSRAADVEDQPEEQLALSLRAARLYVETLAQPERAFRAFERVLAVDARHVEALEALRPIYRAQQKWPRLLAVLETRFAQLAQESESAEFNATGEELLELYEARGVHSEAVLKVVETLLLRGQPTEALLSRCFEETEHLEAWARGRSVCEELYASLSAELRPTLLRASMRFAQAEGDLEAALASGWKLVELDGGDDADLDALENLAREADDKQALRRVFALRVETAEASERAVAQAALALLERDVLGNAEAALALFAELFQEDPENEEWFDATRALAEHLGQHEQLETLLRTRIAHAISDSARAHAELELARHRVKQGQVDEESVELARAALVQGEQLSQALELLEAMLESLADQPALEADVAFELETALRERGDQARLARVLELRAERAGDELPMDTVLELAELQATGLGDRRRAFATLAAAFRRSPEHEALWDVLERFGVRAQAEDRVLEAYLRALEGDNLLTDGQRALLWERIARLAPGRDDALGVRAWQQVLSLEPEHERAYRALKDHYSETQHFEALEALYRQRRELEQDPGSQSQAFRDLAFLLEELMREPGRAAELWLECLQASPDDAQARAQAKRLLAEAQDAHRLAELLREELANADGRAYARLAHELAELLSERLDARGEALELYAELLQNDASDLRAQEAVEACLGHAEARAQAASLLEPIYEAQGAWGHLTRVLDVQRELASSVDDKAELNLRIARVHAQRLEDTAAAQPYLTALMQTHPSWSEARALAWTVAEAEQGLAELVARLLEVTEATPDAPECAELWAEMVPRALTQPEEARDQVLARVLEAQAAEIPTLVMAAEAALAHPVPGTVARAHAVLGEHASEPARRADSLLWQARAAHAQGETQLEEACSLARAATEAEPERLEAWLLLAELHWASKSPAAYLEALEQAQEVDEDTRAIASRYLRMAEVCEEALGDIGRAQSLLESAVDRCGVTQTLIDAWVALALRAQDAHAAAEALQRGLDTAEANAAALPAWQLQLARLELGDLALPAEAVRRLAGLVQDGGGCAEQAHALLVELLGGTDEEAQLAGAELLVSNPGLLDDTGLQVQALRVVGLAERGDTGLERLEQAVELLELDDVQGALREAVTLDLMRVAQESARFAQLAERAQRVVLSEEGQGQLLTCVLEAIENVPQPEERVALALRFASVAEQRQADASARKLLEDARAQAPQDREVWERMDTLLGRLGAHEERVDAMADFAMGLEEDAREASLLRASELAQQALSAERAIELAEEAYRVAESASAAHALLALLRKQDDPAALTDCLEGRSIAGLAALEEDFELLALLLREEAEAERALEAAQRLIERKEAASAALVEALRPLAASARVATEGAFLLEQAARQQLDWRTVYAALETQTETDDPTQRLEALERLAVVSEEHLDDLDAAFTAYSKLLRLEPSEPKYRERVLRHGRLLERWEETASVLAAALDEAGGPHEDALRDLAFDLGALLAPHEARRADAVRIMRRILEADPTNLQAATELVRLLGLGAEAEPRFEAQLQLAELVDDMSQRAQALKRAAEISAVELGDALRATELLREAADALGEAPDVVQMVGYLRAGEQWDALRSLFEEAAEQSVEPELAGHYRVQAAQVALEQLDDPEAAIEGLRGVALEMPAHAENIACLEAWVQRPELKAAILGILDPLYEQLGEWRKRVAVKEALAVEAEDPFEAAQCLSDAAELMKLNDAKPDRVVHTLRRALEKTPDDDMLDARLREVVLATGALQAGVEALELLAHKGDNLELQVARLLTAADWSRTSLGDPQGARRLLDLAHGLDAESVSVLDALIDVLALLEASEALATALGSRAALEGDPELAAALYFRLGRLQEQVLAQPEAACAAYERAYESGEGQDAALEALSRLHRAACAWQALRSVLERQLEITDGPTERARLQAALGSLLRDALGEAGAAELAFVQATEDDPTWPDPFEALRSHYKATKDWEALDGCLRRYLEIPALEDAQRVELLEELGWVALSGTENPSDGLDAYRSVIRLNPRSQVALGGLEQLALDETVGPDALEVLRSTYQDLEDWNALVRVQSRVMAASDEPEQRLALAFAVAETHEHARQAPADALAFLLDLAQTEVLHGNLRSEIWRLARSAEALAETVTSLEGVLRERGLEQEEDLATALESAEVLQEIGAEPSRIGALLQASIELEHIEPPHVAAIDPWLRAGLAAEQLALWLARRVQWADDAGEECQLRADLATCLHALERPPAEVLEALEVSALDAGELRPILELLEGWAGTQGAVGDGASDLLIRYLEQLADHAALLRVWRIRLTLDLSAEAEGAALEGLFEAALAVGDESLAIGAAERLLMRDPETEASLNFLLETPSRAAAEALGRLAAGPQAARFAERAEAEAQAARLLEFEAISVDQTAFVQAFVARDPECLPALRLALKVAELGEDENQQLRCLLTLVRVDRLSDEAPTRLQEAMAMAQALGDDEALAEVAGIALEADPSQSQAFQRLELALERLHRWDALAEHYERSLEMESRLERREQLALKLATLYVERLSRAEDAIQVLLTALGDQPESAGLLGALEAHAEAAGAQDALIAAYERVSDALIGAAATPYRRKLAALLVQEGEPERAASLLRELVDADPSDAQSYDLLLQTLRALGDDSGLMDLLESQLASTDDPSLRAASLAALGELALESDPSRAEQYFTEAWQCDASHAGALSGLVELRLTQGDVAALHELLPHRLGASSDKAALPQLARCFELMQDAITLELKEKLLLRLAQLDVTDRDWGTKLEQHYLDAGQNERYAAFLEERARKAVEAPEASAWLLKLARLQLSQLSDAEAALKTLERAQSLHAEPEGIEALRLEAYLASGQADKVAATIEQQLKDPKRARGKEGAELFRRLGQARRALDDAEAALKAYDQAFRLDLSNVQVLRELGELAYDTEDWSRAQRAYKALLLQKLSPDAGVTKADIYCALGDIAARQGDARRGISMLERALSEDQAHRRAGSLLASLRA